MTDQMVPGLLVVCPQCDATNRIPPGRPPGGGRCGRCKTPLFVGRPVELDAIRLGRHRDNGELPLLIDFWAPWCGPCRSMAPFFEKAASQLEPRVRLVKINTEENPALAEQHGIRSIPTMVLLGRGREIARFTGAMDLQHILSWTRQHLGVR